MRRTLLLLAGLLAVVADGPLAAPDVLRQARSAAPAGYELAAAGGAATTAFARSGGPALGLGLHEGTGTGPGAAPRRPDARLLRTLPTTTFTSTRAANRTRAVAHLEFAAPSALRRAGHLAFHTTTPPPFRIV